MASNLQQPGNGNGNGCGACGWNHGRGNCKLTPYPALEYQPWDSAGYSYYQSAAAHQFAPASKKHLEVTECCGLVLDDDADHASASYDYGGAGAGLGALTGRGDDQAPRADAALC